MWYGAGAVTVVGLLVACGGKVTWVEDGGTPSGGAGGTGSTTSKATSSTKSVTSTANVSTVQQGTSVVATSVSSGNVMPGCDTGEFNNVDSQVCQDCIDCSINSLCFQQYNTFENSADAQEFLGCLENCGGPMCQQKCQNDHPMGSQIYFQLVDCVLCQSCANNCGEDSGCFGPPPPNGSSSGQGPG